MRIGFHFLHPLTFHCYISIILQYRIKQLVIQFFRQCGFFSMQGIQQKFHLQFHTIIVGERQHHIGKTKAVCLTHPTDTANHSYISIGYKINLLTTLRPKIVILRHHQQVTAVQFILPKQNRIPDSLIINIRPFIGTADHNRFVHTCLTVTIIDYLNQLTTRNHPDIRKPFHTDRRQSEKIFLGYVAAQFCRIPKNPRIMHLTDHLSELRLIYFHAIPA